MTVTERQAVPRRFAEVSALVEDGPGRFSAAIDPEWTIRGKPNGGYLLAMLGRAATWQRAHDHVIAASAHYLRSPEPGPVSIETEVLRAGRSASQVRARLLSDGQSCVEALVTVSHLEGGTVPYFDGGVPARGEVAFEDCPRLVSTLPGGMRVAIMEQVEVRLEPGSLGFTTGCPSGVGELRGWLSLPGGDAFDPTSLVYAVDAFPPATFDIEFAGWVPTFELTVYVRALPAPGPVQVLQRARLIESGRLDEACFVWDAKGRLVAQGTQLAGVRLG
jgi:acyl-coenzyme A thioesterase PaaI-like protein